MVRACTDNYSFWLTGYYDDFNSARAVADDLNNPSTTVSYSSLKSHHGNPMNGEATSNPRYRWSIVDRENYSTALDAITGVTMGEFSKLKNSGMFEWLSHDTNRNSNSNWGGRAQLQYPNGLAPNRFKFGDGTSNTNYKDTGIASGDGYQLIANGYDTTGTYLLPVGQEDATFRRSAMEPYQTSDGSSGITGTQYANKKAGQFDSWYTSSEPNRYYQSAHLTGTWTGECLSFSGSDTNVTPENLFYTIKSPGGKPFLVIKRVNNGTGEAVPSITYDGALNTRLDNDVFHTRVAARCHHGDIDQANTIRGSSFANGEYPVEVDFQVGFPTTSAGVTTTAGLTGTPAIQFKLILGTTSGTSGLTGNYAHFSSYDCYGASFIGASAQTHTNDDAWLDIDFRIDFTNQKFFPYVNGTRVGLTQGYSLNGTSFGGNVSANEIYGYEMYHQPHTSGATSTAKAACYLLLDRVGIVRYLTNPLSKKDRHAETPISDVRLSMPNNGFSIVNLTILDDKDDGVAGTSSSNYTYNLKQLFSNTDPVDCGLLIFASDEVQRTDRPIWRGTIDNMTIGQKISAREIKLQATHNAATLNKQIPMWDVGQLQLDTGYWMAETEGLKSIMHMGTRPLKMLHHKLGFGQDNAFSENANQRLQLGSGMPIQMYNNEDPDHGPNSIEEQYAGQGFAGIAQVTLNASGNLAAVDDAGSGSVKTALALPHSTSITASDTITVTGTSNHNFTNGAIAKVHEYSGTERRNLKTWIVMDSLTYTPKSSKIIYLGGKIPTDTGQLYSIWNQFFPSSEIENRWQEFLTNRAAGQYTMSSSNNTIIMFDTDPGLQVGDTFYVNQMNIDEDNTTTTSNQSTNASPLLEQLKGEYRVSSIKTVKDIYTVDRSGTTFAATPNITYVVTETPFPEHAEEKYGKITTNATTLSGNKRYYWTNDRGFMLDESGNLDDVQYRAQHARWMRDLPKSLWFQYHFGNIEYDPLGANTNTDITNGYNPNDTSVRNSSTNSNVPVDISKDDKHVQISQVLYNALVAQQAWAGVAEIRAEGFWTSGPDIGKDSGTQPNKYGRFIWQDLQNISGNYYMLGCKYIDADFAVGSGTKSYQGTNRTFKNCVWVLPLKFNNNYKHLWVLWADMRIDGNADADGGTRKTEFGLIPPSTDYKVNLNYIDKLDADGIADKFTELKVNEDLVLYDISATDPCTNGAFSKPANYGVGTSSTALESVALSANSGGIGGQATQSLLVTKNNHGITSDYVHLFNTNLHDGVHKVLHNATNTLVLDKKFAGTDTGAAIGGTRLVPVSEDSDTRYQDWENKGGAMCIVDTSPFFNLNTYTNQGGAYQVSGGETDLDDYTVETTGFPALIDNYWAEAIVSDNNKATGQTTHPNAYKVISDVTALKTDVIIGDAGIEVDNIDIFPNSGTGRFLMKEENTGSNEQTIHQHYFKWSSKNTTERTGTAMTNVTESGATKYILRLAGTDWTTLGLSEGMMIKNTTTGKNHRIEEVGDGTDTDILIINRGTIGGGVTAGHIWTNTDDWAIPIQLGGVWSMTAKLSDGAKNNPNEIMREINDAYAASGGRVGMNRAFDIKDEPDQTSSDYEYEIVTVSTTIFTASQNITRLVMHIDGKIEAKNSGTFYDNDKLRMLWNASLTKNWNPPTKLTSFYDINNVPITKNMTPDGTTGTIDDYGGVVNAGVKPLTNTLRDIAKGSGFGTTNNNHTSFSWLSGKDGRIDFRPKFNSGQVFNRDNMTTNSLKTEVSGAISNVRVFYNQNKDFIDYPSATTTSTTNWKVLEFPKIFSKKEAERLAQKEYNTSRKTNASLSIMPNDTSYTEDGTTSLVSSKFTDTGRYGYIADPYIALQGKNDDNILPTSWTRLGTGGSLFTGMSNALDGNLGTGGTLLARFGKGGYSQANTSASDIAWANNFYWYGSSSVSHAVQVVHVPNHCPTVSEETGEELRVFVTLAENQTPTTQETIDDVQFNIWLIDYEYSNDRIKAANITGTGGPNSLNGANRYSRTIVKGSGFYEVPIPRSYWNNSGAAFSPSRTMTISFNAEYCKDLLRQRCGDPSGSNIYKNANTLVGITAGTSAGNITTGNTDSVFPLGGRTFGEFYMFHGDSSRAMWNAPRIHVVRDWAYHPASFVKVTDAGLGYNDTTFVIKQIDWSIQAGGNDSVVLNLSVDESLRADNITSFLPGNTVMKPTFPAPPQATIPPPSVPGIEDGGSDSRPRRPPVGAVGGGVWANIVQNIRGMNDFNRGTSSRMRGRMNSVGDDIGAGESRILGAKRASATPQTNAAHTPPTNVNVGSGNATNTSTGFTFPGVGNVEDTNSPYFSSAFTQTFTIPNHTTSDTLQIVGNVTHLGTGTAILTARINCNNIEYTQSTLIQPNIASQQITLFESRVSGADVANTSVELELSRVAGSGEDTSQYNSVTVNNIGIKQSMTSVQTTSASNQLAPSG